MLEVNVELFSRSCDNHESHLAVIGHAEIKAGSMGRLSFASQWNIWRHCPRLAFASWAVKDPNLSSPMPTTSLWLTRYSGRRRCP